METKRSIAFTGLNSNRYGVKGNRIGDCDRMHCFLAVGFGVDPPVLNKELNGWPFEGQVAGSPPSDLTAGTAF